MRKTFITIFGCSLLVIIPTRLSADINSNKNQVTSFSQPTPADWGSLHRAAAGLEIVLDIYRLALVELVPAAKRLEQEAQNLAVDSRTPLPPIVKDVFSRLAFAIKNRVPPNALPVLSRGYHVEVLDAFEKLSAVEHFGDVAKPYEILFRAITHVSQLADTIIDLYSRQRPVQVTLVDPHLILDDINEALDEVTIAERKIVNLRKRKASLGEQFQAFLRLEISLGHVLDLIAAAEDAGLHIGFEVQLSTTNFASILTRVKQQLKQLQKVLLIFQATPDKMNGPLYALMVDPVPSNIKDTWQARLSWPIQVGQRLRSIRIYRQDDLMGIQERLVQAFVCEGKDQNEARVMVKQAMEDVPQKVRLLIEEAPGRSQYTEIFSEAPLAPPRYRVVPVSAFGTEGEGLNQVAIRISTGFLGPPFLRATLRRPEPNSKKFYQDYDAIDLHWQPSPNDWIYHALPSDQKQIEPIVDFYRIYRSESKGQRRLVARIPAGVIQHIDRAPVSSIQTGIDYTIEAVSTNGLKADLQSNCQTQHVQRQNIGEAISLAKMGYARIGTRPRIQKKIQTRLENKNELAKEKHAFFRRPHLEQRVKLKEWWQTVSLEQKRRWLKNWKSLFSSSALNDWLNRPPLVLLPDVLKLAKADTWLTKQNSLLQAEVNRWWNLLDLENRRKQINSWITKFRFPDFRLPLAPTISAHLKSQHVPRIFRVLAWWESRDTLDIAPIENEWQDLDEIQKAKKIAVWFNNLPQLEKTVTKLPVWHALSEKEQALLLDQAYQDLPDALYPALLAWLKWYEIQHGDITQLRKVLRHEIGWFWRLWEELRFFIRPMHQKLGLGLSTIVIALVSFVLFVLLYRMRRRV